MNAFTQEQVQDLLSTVHGDEHEHLDSFAPQIARQLLATMRREERLKERIAKKDRELLGNRENVKRLKAKVRQLEGRKKIPFINQDDTIE